MKVRDIMNPRVDAIEPTSTVQAAAQRMRSDNTGALAVSDEGHLLGMITDRDITIRAVAIDRTPSRTSVSEVMSENLYCALADDAVENAARTMAEHQVRRLPVLDGDDRLIGMISLADLARASVDLAHRVLLHVTEPTGVPRR